MIKTLDIQVSGIVDEIGVDLNEYDLGSIHVLKLVVHVQRDGKRFDWQDRFSDFKLRKAATTLDSTSDSSQPVFDVERVEAVVTRYLQRMELEDVTPSRGHWSFDHLPQYCKSYMVELWGAFASWLNPPETDSHAEEKA